MVADCLSQPVNAVTIGCMCLAGNGETLMKELDTFMIS